ncbi:MAG: hypothetical protein ACE5GL_07715, partial [Calditrichia bacterium]
VSYSSRKKPDYILKGKIRSFEEWDEGDNWYGSVSITFGLQNSQSQQIVWEKGYSEKTPVAKKEPVEVVKAINISLNKIIQQVIADVGETLRNHQ